MSHRIALALTFFPLSIPLASGEINVNPPPDKAAIVVYRPARVPGAVFQDNIDLPLVYDEQWISTVSKGKHFVFYGWPGVHKIEPAIAMYRMAPDARCGSSTMNLDVKPSETYYIKVVPASCTSGAALTLMEKESAEKDLTASEPVEWAKDLVDGTLADVHPVPPQAGDGNSQCAPVEWIPDIDSTKTWGSKRLSILHGTIFLQSDSLLLQLKPGASDTTPLAVTIAYADIARVEVKKQVLRRVVLITRKSGRLDSFSVLSTGGGRVHNERTQACRDQLAAKLPG